MKEERLKDIAKYPTGKLNSNASTENGEYPFFTCAHEIYRIDKYAYDGEYVLLGGNNANGDFPIFYYNGKFEAYQRTYLIQPLDENQYSTRFLFYAIGLKLSQMKTNAAGTATKFLTKPIIDKIAIPQIDFAIQRRIVSILSSYDNLIETNNRRIKLLEQMAERIYKEWFVRFRFPGHENCKMIDGLPEGWKVDTLGHFGINLDSGSRPKGGIDDSIKEGIPSLGAEAIKNLAEFDYSSVKRVPFEFYSKMKRGRNTGNDILLYKDGAYIGKTTMFRDGFPYEHYAINEHVFFISPKNEIYKNFLYFTLHQEAFFQLMQNLNRNAAQPGLSQGDINRIKMTIPNEKTVEAFNKVIDQMLSLIFKLASQNANLARQRDMLLPRLMSGKIELK